jgi:hypothetical protein
MKTWCNYFEDKYNFNNVQAPFYVMSSCFHAPQEIIIVSPNGRSQCWNSEMIVATAITNHMYTEIRHIYIYIGYLDIHWIFQKGNRECKSMQKSGYRA